MIQDYFTLPVGSEDDLSEDDDADGGQAKTERKATQRKIILNYNNDNDNKIPINRLTTLAVTVSEVCDDGY